MVSAIDRAKRLLVNLLKTLAATYGVVLQLSRDSSDVDVRKAFKKVSRKAHPDQGGRVGNAPPSSQRKFCSFAGGRGHKRQRSIAMQSSSPGKGLENKFLISSIFALSLFVPVPKAKTIFIFVSGPEKRQKNTHRCS